MQKTIVRCLGALLACLLVGVLASSSPAADRTQLEDARGVLEAKQSELLALKDVDKVELPALDVNAFRADDIARDQLGLPPRYAVPHPAVVTPWDSGTWEALDQDMLIWRLLVRCDNAISMNFGFTTYVMPPHGELHLYAADGSHRIRTFTSADNEDHRQLWTPPVFSGEVVIEVRVPLKHFNDLELELTSINPGYRGFGEMIEAGTRSGSCNVDVVCPEGDDWRDQIASVAVISTGGSTFCTGFMVNNVRADLTPFFMTANHCGISSGNAASLVTFWNYENSTCRPPGSGASGGPGDGSLSQFLTGSTWLAGGSASDFTLVVLDDDPDPTWEVYFAGWDARDQDAAGGVAIHHPSTDEKRISFEFDGLQQTFGLVSGPPAPSGDHILVNDWDIGTTEPGSSGSPLFDIDTKRIIGQLHGGLAACGNNSYDSYGAWHWSYDNGGTATTSLKPHLDPDNTGVLFIDGITSAGLAVTPGGNTLSVGVVGGPFTNDTVVYTLSNPSPFTVNYEVSIDGGGTAPVLINGGTTPISGMLASGGGTAMVTVTYDASAASFPAGLYSTDILFEDQTNSRTITKTHDLEIGLTQVAVTPATALQSGGPVGGPFNATQVYTITSERPTPVSVEISASDNWISVNGGAGPVVVNLNGTGDSTMVTVGFSASANALTNGLYMGSVSFTNLAGGAGDSTRDVVLDVGRFTYFSNDTPIAINDNSSFTSTITVSDGYCIGDVDVVIDLSHTYIGDLIVELTSPEGTTVRLHNRTGGTAEDIMQTYDDSTEPVDGPGLLADFNGEIVTGDWTLFVSDNAGADTGSLNEWRLKIASSGSICPPVAGDVSLNIPDTVTSSIALDVSSALGPGIADVIIESLPANGTLSDPNGGTINSVPYTLASMGTNVNYKPNALFIGPDSFTYKANDGQDSNTATVSLDIGIAEVLADFPMDSDPGWTTQGQWAFGQPAGIDDDPSSGYTGSNVYGYNLNGDYPNNLSPQYLTTGAIDCTDAISVVLEFQRWLGVESSIFDEASVDVSNDGSSWTTIWVHTSSSFTDPDWMFQSFDISGIADNQATVYVRWRMGKTDGSVTYCGWNIDDVQIKGVLPPEPPLPCPGDCDGSGNVDIGDLNLVLGNFGTAGPAGDCDGSGAVDIADLNQVIGNFGVMCP